VKAVAQDAVNRTTQEGTVISKPAHTVCLAFLEPGLVAIGSEEAIKSSIDAQLTAHSITSNNDMMELVADIDAGNNAWAVGRFDALQTQAHLPAEIASKIPSIKTFAVMTHVDGGLSGTLRAETRDDQSAENLRQVFQGLLALGRMQNDPKATAIVNSLQLSGKGHTVALSFAVPAEIFDAIQSQAHLPAEISSKIPAIKTFAVMTHVDGGLSGTLRAETRDDQSAENLRQVVQGLLALGRMQNDPKATAIVNSLQLSGKGHTVALSFAVPAEIFDAIGAMKKDGGLHLHQLPKELHELHAEQAPHAPHAPQAPKPPTPPAPQK